MQMLTTRRWTDGAVVLAACVGTIIGSLVTGTMALATYFSSSPTAVVTESGLCWIGNSGRKTRAGAEIRSNGGRVVFHRPAAILQHGGDAVSDHAVKTLLQVDPKHCVRLIKN